MPLSPDTALAASPLIQRLPAPTRQRVLEALVPVELLAGQVLFEEGEAADAIYLVEQGFLDVLAGEGRLVAIRGPGAVLGELALLQDRRRTASLQAATDALLWRLDMDEAREIAETHAHFALGLGQIVAARLNAGVDENQAMLRPRVLVIVVEAGDPRAEAACAALRRRLREQDAIASLHDLRWDDSGAGPGSPEHVAEPRRFGQTLSRYRELVLWPRPGEPGLARCPRSWRARRRSGSGGGASPRRSPRACLRSRPGAAGGP